MFESRRLYRIEASGGRPSGEVERRLIHGSRIDMKSKPHLTKWTLAMAIKIRRFDTSAETEADRERAIERSERA